MTDSQKVSLTAEATETTEKYHLKSNSYLCGLCALCGESVVFASPSKNDKFAKSLVMAKLKVRYPRSSGVAKAEAYM
jgi:hypothetical protein